MIKLIILCSAITYLYGGIELIGGAGARLKCDKRQSISMKLNRGGFCTGIAQSTAIFTEAG